MYINVVGPPLILPSQVLKNGEPQQQLDYIHEEIVAKGEDKYTTLRRVRGGGVHGQLFRAYSNSACFTVQFHRNSNRAYSNSIIQYLCYIKA